MKFNLSLVDLLLVGVSPTIVGFLNYYRHLPLTDGNIAEVIEDLRNYDKQNFELTDKGFQLGKLQFVYPHGYITHTSDDNTKTMMSTGWTIDVEGGLLNTNATSSSTVTYMEDEINRGSFSAENEDIKLFGVFNESKVAYTTKTQDNGEDISVKRTVTYSDGILILKSVRHVDNVHEGTTETSCYDVGTFLNHEMK